MIQEISNVNSGLLQYNSESNIESGDDVKQAFLALLQGLVGMVPHGPSAPVMVDVPRVAALHQDKSAAPRAEESRKYTEPSTSQLKSGDQGEAKDTASPKSPVVSADAPVSKDATSGEEVLKSSKETAEESVKTEGDSAIKQETAVSKAPITAADTSTSATVVKADAKLANNPANIIEQTAEANLPGEAISEQKAAALQTAPASKEVKITKESPVETAVDTAMGHEHVVDHSKQDIVGNAPSKTELSTVATVVAKSAIQKEGTSELLADDQDASEQSQLADEILGALIGKSEGVNAKAPTSAPVFDTRAAALNIKTQLPVPALMAQAVEDSVLSKINASAGTVEQMGLSLKDSSQKAHGGQQARANAAVSEPQQQKYIDKVKEVLERAALTKTMDSINVKIDPPHLGEITVRVVQKNGEIFARLIPESKEVEQTLKTKVNELAGVLQALGFKPDEVHVVIGNDPVDFSKFISHPGHQGQRGNGKEANAFSHGGGKRKGFVDAGDGIESTIQSFPRGRLEEASGWVA